MPSKHRKAKQEAKQEEVKYNTLDEDFLRRIFDEFDKDKSGYLEREECMAALFKIGSKLRLEDLDTDGDKRISFAEFAVFTELTGRHTHPIFKGAQTNISTDGASKTGISIFAGSAHLNEAFMQRASHAWRKLGAVARESGFTHQNLQKVFKSIDLDHDGNLDPGEIRAAIKTKAPELTEMDITTMLLCADKNADGKITEDEFIDLMLHGHEHDIDYWNSYGERDMHTSVVKDRSHQIRF